MQEVFAEGLNDGPIIGALSVVYAAGHFLSLDRVIRNTDKFKKQRRIIFYLDSKPGQIGSLLLLELLKISDGDTFSKHKFVMDLDKRYFQVNDLNVSSGEINEALSRMFRKTLKKYFGVDGKRFVRKPFVLKLQELNLKNQASVNYESYKHLIDNQTYDLVKNLNRSIA